MKAPQINTPSESIDRRLAEERRRTDRALFWLGAVFFLVLLLSLSVFMAVGFFALRSSTRTRQLAYEADARTAAFASDLIGVQARADKVEAGQIDLRENLDETRRDLAREGEQWGIEAARLRELFESRRETEGGALAGMAAQIRTLSDGASARDAALAALTEEVRSLASSRTAASDPAAQGADLTAKPDAAAPPADVPGLSVRPGHALSRPSPAEALPPPSPPAPAETAPLTPVGAAASDETVREVAVLTFPNGDRYEGEFKDGLFDGQGTYHFANGDRYDGEFRDDMKHGQGVLKFANGDLYSGDFANDRMHGTGSMVYAGRNKYVGEFRNGKRHGRGVLTFPNGDRYEGEFEDDLRQGQGTYYFSDGSVYSGGFKDGRRHGRGRYAYPDGSVYQGEFKDGRKHGYGESIYPGGEKIAGYWSEDRFERAAE